MQAAPAVFAALLVNEYIVILQGSSLQTVMIYANSKNTEIRAKLKLRSTSRGANNRLDVESIVSFDKADGISTPVIGMCAGRPLVVCLFYSFYCIIQDKQSKHQPDPH